MNQTKKIIFILLVIAIFYYFYCCFPPSKRYPDFINSSFKEGFQQVDSAKIVDLPLSQYMIMGAYNAAYDGTIMSTEQLASVLMTGARFIDLEIRSLNNNPVLIKTKNNGSTSLSSNNIVYFNDALTTINNYAFSVVPNNQDPLFLHFRFIINDADNESSVYCNVAYYLNAFFGQGNLYTGPVDSTTPLSALRGKVVICIDLSTAPNYKNATKCSTESPTTLASLVNIETNGSKWLTTDYKSVTSAPPILINEKPQCTIANANNNPPLLNLVVPPIDKKNPYASLKNPSPVDLNQFVVMGGCQTILFMFYQKDTGNNEYSFYNRVFQDLRTSFAPMCSAINYIKDHYDSFPGAQTANYPPR
jgi:hypothetical protein